MVRPSEAGFTVAIDPAEWYRLKKELDKFDPEIIRTLRKRMRNAGNVAVGAVKASLYRRPPMGGVDPQGMREALAAATKVRLSFAARAAGVKIVTTSAGLPASEKSLLVAYNKKKAIRHPLFGNKAVWFEQPGRPYFGSVIHAALDQALATEIRAALDEAVQKIGAVGR